MSYIDPLLEKSRDFPSLAKLGVKPPAFKFLNASESFGGITKVPFLPPGPFTVETSSCLLTEAMKLPPLPSCILSALTPGSRISERL